MEMVGEVEFSYHESSSQYSYEWNFGGKTLDEYIIFNSLGSTFAACSDEIKFQAGVLASTEHYVKFFVNGNNGEVFVKISFGETKFDDHGIYTNCNIYKASVSVAVNEKTASITLPFELLDQDEKNSLAMRRICKPEEVRNITQNQATVFWYRSAISAGNFWGYRYSSKDILRRKNFIRSLTFKTEIFHRYWHKDTLKTKLSWKNNGAQEFSDRQNRGTLDTKPFFLNREFSDFVIQSRGRHFPVHKIILADKCPVFARMFQQPLRETEEGKVIIEDADPQAVEEFLRFIYTGEAKFEENPAALFVIADKYNVDELKLICEKVLVNKVNEDNFLDLFSLGKLLNSDCLTGKCCQMFKKKKNDLLKTEDDVVKFSDEYPDLMLKLSRGEI